MTHDGLLNVDGRSLMGNEANLKGRARLGSRVEIRDSRIKMGNLVSFLRRRLAESVASG